MSKDLVFNIGNLFNSTSIDGALHQHGADHFYIAPYQRGYKWASSRPNDAVCLLMHDLLDAFESRSEYYLQFITTKLSENKGLKVLEVIDGQQRLTSLTLLLSVLHFRSGNKIPPISNGKLSYQVRENVTAFFDEYVYNNIQPIIKSDWHSFVVQYPTCDEQDIFYLYNAIQKIYEAFNTPAFSSGELVAEFEKYLKEEVKIILNNIEGNISCEKVFSNLNDNKVELTNAELIKGLFLTKSARETGENEKRAYKEIAEIRAVIGRQWDDTVAWVNRKEIRNFFFPGSDSPIEELLLLVGLKNGFQEINEQTESKDLFNYFQSLIKKANKSASDLFTDLKKIRLILNDWFEDSTLYNDIGFLIFAKRNGEQFSIRQLLPSLEYSKSYLKNDLEEKKGALLSFQLKQLAYGDNTNEIHNTLLALSIFSDNNKFDFVAFNENKWSLEHIFPQTPQDLPDTLGKKDISLINALLLNEVTKESKISQKVIAKEEDQNLRQILQSLKVKLTKEECLLTAEEKVQIYKLMKTDKLNSIGNMALLSGKDNSSNKNGMFDKKRQNIVKRISNGSFVPKHTYDVFSKLLSKDMISDLSVWTEQDIIAHQTWMTERINVIIKCN